MKSANSSGCLEVDGIFLGDAGNGLGRQPDFPASIEPDGDVSSVTGDVPYFARAEGGDHTLSHRKVLEESLPQGRDVGEGERTPHVRALVAPVGDQDAGDA